MSGFKWDDGIDGADMNSGQTKQVLNYSRDLILQLDQRRHWAVCVITLNPAMPAALRPDVPSEHYFTKLQRKFVLKHAPEKHLWRLCFLGRVTPPPDGDGDAPVVVEQATTEQVAVSAVARERGRTKDENWTARAFDLLLSLAAALVAAWRIPARLRRFRAVNADSFAAISARIEAAQARWREAKAAFEQRRDDIAAALARFESEFVGSTEQESYAYGRYERRTIWLAGVPLEISTLVSDKIDWDSWPFGRRVEEDLLLD
jgi:hypothetical protein